MRTSIKLCSMLIYIAFILIASAPALAENTPNYSVSIPCQFDGFVTEFHNGIASVQNGGKSGLIDKAGNVIAPFVYDNIYLSNSTRGRVPFNYFIAIKDGKWGVLDRTGKNIVPCEYDSIFNIGTDIIRVGKGTPRPPGGGTIDGLWGLFDLKTGKEILPVKYVNILPANDNLLFSISLDNKVCVIDRAGKLIVPAGTYDYIGEFNWEFAVATKNGWWGIIDRTGKALTPFIYNETGVFENGAFFTIKDLKTTIYDNTGKVIAPEGKYNVAHRVAGNLTFVERDGKFGAIDMTGQEIVPLIYSDIIETKNGLATVFIGEKSAVINQSGEVILPLDKYGSIELHDDGCIHVMLSNNKWILKNYNGNTIPTGEYHFIGDMNDGYVVVNNQRGYGILNEEGEIIVPFGEFDDIDNKISENMVAVHKDQLIGYIELPKYVSPPDNWAKHEVDSAITAGLVPKDMCEKYQDNITRADFCRLVVNLIEKVTGMKIDAFMSTRGMSNRVSDPIAFVDTNNPVVMAANRLGIVYGIGNNKFNPNGVIKRQDAAVMLQRTAKVLGFTKPNGIPEVFADSDNFSSYAIDAISFVSSIIDKGSNNKVMGSTGNNNFSPLSTYTRQQAYISIMRLYNAYYYQ